MITFTGDPVFLGDKSIFANTVELHFDVVYRTDTSVVAIMYVFDTGTLIGKYETAYTAAEVNAESTTETSYTGEFNQAVQQLEKLRLEALNPTNTFTITL